MGMHMSLQASALGGSIIERCRRGGRRFPFFAFLATGHGVGGKEEKIKKRSNNFHTFLLLRRCLRPVSYPYGNWNAFYRAVGSRNAIFLGVSCLILGCEMSQNVGKVF